MQHQKCQSVSHVTGLLSFSICSVGDQTHEFIHVRQVFLWLSYIPIPAPTISIKQNLM